MAMIAEDILIRVFPSVRTGSGRKRMVPSVPTPVERYATFKHRYTMQHPEVPVNNYPWKFRQPKEEPEASEEATA